jgi:hypothetical protein
MNKGTIQKSVQNVKENDEMNTRIRKKRKAKIMP